jgi:hypothetical protein
MPSKTFCRRQVLRLDRPADGLPVVAEQGLFELAGTMHERGDEHTMVQVDCEGAQIEEFVMQGAERQTIGFGVRAACLMPLDVGRIKPDRDVAYPNVEAAESAPVLVRREHSRPEGWVTRWRLL